MVRCGSCGTARCNSANEYFCENENTLSKVGVSDERDNAADPRWFRSFSVFQGNRDHLFVSARLPPWENLFTTHSCHKRHDATWKYDKYFKELILL